MRSLYKEFWNDSRKKDFHEKGCLTPSPLAVVLLKLGDSRQSTRDSQLTDPRDRFLEGGTIE